MKKTFYKTEHFIYRQWDRGVNDEVIEKIACKLRGVPQKKSVIIASTDLLKKAGIAVKNTTNLIVISKGKVLITLFFVDDLYNYLKSLRGKLNTIIL